MLAFLERPKCLLKMMSVFRHEFCQYGAESAFCRRFEALIGGTQSGRLGGILHTVRLFLASPLNESILRLHK